LSLAVSRNAAILAIGRTESNSKSWSLTAVSLQDGKEIWSVPIEERPLPDGICIDESGGVSVTLQNGGLVSFGAP
jgi:outer membrane protein assembly factor BamB